MNTCDTCKWWSKKVVSVTSFEACRECLNDKLGRINAGDSDGLYAPHEASISGWGFGVFTNPKFGCVHHEP